MGYAHGNYSFLASYIESNFLQKNLTILLEFGIPSSAIKKLSLYIANNIETKDLFNIIKQLDLNQIDLLSYEVKKIQELIES